MLGNYFFGECMEEIRRLRGSVRRVEPVPFLPFFVLEHQKDR